MTHLTLTKLDDNATEEQAIATTILAFPRSGTTPTTMLRSRRGTPSVYINAASTAEELIATTKMRVDPAREQVTTADGMVTATTSPILNVTSGSWTNIM